MKQTWPLVLILALAPACAPFRLAERPMGEQDSGDGILVGRVCIRDMPAVRWDDPYATPVTQRVLMVQVQTADGQRRMAPCQANGLFSARVPPGPTAVTALTMTTPQGAWVTMTATRPLTLNVAGACDLGAITATVPAAYAGRWATVRQRQRVIMQRATVPVDLTLMPDPETVLELQDLAAGGWTWTTHPPTVRQGIYAEFEALCRRLGLN
jgi:hypothetical protein